MKRAPAAGCAAEPSATAVYASPRASVISCESTTVFELATLIRTSYLPAGRVRYPLAERKATFETALLPLT